LSRAAAVSRLVRGAVVSGQMMPQPVRTAVLDPRTAEAATPEQALAVARLQAEALVADARAEAEAIREAARAQGEQEGRVKVEAELREVIDRAGTLVTQFAEARDAMLASVSGRVVDAIVHIAGVVAQGAIVADRGRLEAIARKALEAIRDDDHIVLRLHPDDAALLAPAREDLERACGTHLTFRSDRSVVRGGCVVETSRGLVDARLDAKLVAIHTALMRNGDAA